jgi:hypothetical protein
MVFLKLEEILRYPVGNKPVRGNDQALVDILSIDGDASLPVGLDDVAGFVEI